jgi:acyl carrier protein
VVHEITPIEHTSAPVGSARRERCEELTVCVPMNTELFDEVVRILRDKFQVDAASLRPDTTLESLGLDSLTLMEFVFAVEDQYSVRVPEDKLDPRQSGITLQHLVQLLDDERRKAPSASQAEAA